MVLMTSVCSIVYSIVAALSEFPSMTGITIVDEYSGQKQNMPLEGLTVSVGLQSGMVTHGDGESTVQYGNAPSHITVRINICAPRSSGGSACLGALDKVISALKNNIGTLDISEISIGELSHSSLISGLLLPLSVTIDTGNAF